MLPPNALIIDLDGTLYVGEDPVPGAVEAIRILSDLGVPRRYVTNTTRVSRAQLHQKLVRLGFAVTEDDIFTAARAAAQRLREEGRGRLLLCVSEAAHADFAGFDLVDSSPDAVVVGDMGEQWSYDLLNRCFRAIMEGALLVAIQRNRYWMTPSGLALDAGPFVAALEYATGASATVVGKPSADFFRLALASLDRRADEVMMIGDDVEIDVGGAQAAGLRGALVRTGKYSDAALRSSGVVPDDIADDLHSLVRRWSASW